MSTEEKKVSVVGSPAINLEETIAQDLAESEEKQDTAIPTTETPAPAFDISKLNHEQLQSLKAALSAVPDKALNANEKRKVRIRALDIDDTRKYVLDFKNAFLGLVDDETQQRKVERHIIPVLFEGETEFKNIEYNRFMGLTQVLCTVLDMQRRDVPEVEGETDDQYGQLVEMVKTRVEYTLKVEVPEGRTLDLPGRIANA